MTAKKISKKEVAMIISFLFLLTVLTIKSTMIDEVKNLNSTEQQFKDFVDYSVEEEKNGILENTGILVYRVYHIEMADEEEKAVLRYEDPETGEMTEVVQDGRYEASVRGYLLWILPINQFSVTAEIEE
ncbi:MAG: hypothetical protein KA282_02925 [Clostridia bacterium]|nr:hypothetical protein [Clostridia bacterium]